MRLEHAATGKSLTDLKEWEPETPRKPDKIDEDFGPAAGLVRWLGGEESNPATEIVKSKTFLSPQVSTPDSAEAAASETKETPASEAVAKRRRAMRPRTDIEALNRKDQATTDRGTAAINTKRDQERERQESARERFVEQLLEKAKSPRERLQEGVGTIGEALKSRDIGPIEAAAAESQLARDVFGADEKPDAAEAKPKKKEPPRDAGAAVQRGSSEAFSAIIKGASRGQGGDDHAKKTAENTEKQFHVAEQQLAELKKAAAKPATPVQVITF